MNKIISTKERIFISLVGSSGSAKSHLIHEWLKIRTFQPEFDKIYYFYQHYQPLYGLISKDVKNIQFVEVDFEFNQNLPNSGTKCLLIFTTLVKRFPALKISLKNQELENIMDSAQYILNTIYFIRGD